MESEPGKSLAGVWVYLSRDEAVQLWDAMNAWTQEPGETGWHTHIADSRGNELTVAVGEPDDPEFR